MVLNQDISDQRVWIRLTRQNNGITRWITLRIFNIIKIILRTKLMLRTQIWGLYSLGKIIFYRKLTISNMVGKLGLRLFHKVSTTILKNQRMSLRIVTNRIFPRTKQVRNFLCKTLSKFWKCPKKDWILKILTITIGPSFLIVCNLLKTRTWKVWWMHQVKKILLRTRMTLSRIKGI